MNKFAKYVPEADKKKQREHIGVTWDSLPDKPFGEVVETVSVECDYYNNGSTNTLNIDMSLVPGNVYQIEISKDGEVFDAVSCTAYETSIMNISAIVVGNAELANGTGGNSESVMIAYAPSHNAYMGAIDGELGDYHIKVTGPAARIKTLDPKYLPEMVVAVEINDDNTVTLDKTFAEINDHCMQRGTVRFETFVDNSLLTTSLSQLYIGLQAFFTFTDYSFTNNHTNVNERMYVCSLYDNDTGIVVINERTLGGTVDS